MQVVVARNHRVPAVTQMVWYKVGAADDPLRKSGRATFSNT
jgi:zinc protease